MSESSSWRCWRHPVSPPGRAAAGPAGLVSPGLGGRTAAAVPAATAGARGELQGQPAPVAMVGAARALAATAWAGAATPAAAAPSPREAPERRAGAAGQAPAD